jgi:hypothetical protein
MTIDDIDRYYEKHSIYRSIIICDTEDTANEMIHELHQKDYTLCSILDSDLTDDRPLFMNTLRYFQTSMYRMLVITYWVFLHMPDVIQALVLPHQNLVIYYNLDTCVTQIISEWLQDSKRAGFVEVLNILSV